MNPLMQQLGIDRMPIDQRIELVHEIWDSIASEPGSGHLSEPQKRELAQRLEAYRQNPMDVVPWSEVKARALTRLQP